MDDISSISSIDQKMAEMRIKNLELLKRHQEIQEDRQLAERLGATTTTVESIKDTKTMRGATKNRTLVITNQQNLQENQHERMHRPPVRRKFENDRNDTQTQRAQRVDYNQLKRERAHEMTNQPQNNNKNNKQINPELLEYAYPFHYRSKNNNDADEPAHAKKLVIVNNKAGRIGSGRFNQQQRTQEQGQRKREERMRRCTVQDNGHAGGGNEFHLDVPPMPIWQNGSMPPMHVQLVPTNLNGMDHLVNSSGDQMEQSGYLHNFVYQSPVQATSFNGHGTVYFAHPPPPIATGPPSSQSQTHFHQYHSPRTFENSNRHQFSHLPHFQFQSAPPPAPLSQPTAPSSSTSNIHQQQENPSIDLPPRYRRLKTPEYENRITQQRPMSGDFEHLHNSSSRFNNDNRFQARPQSFYDFSSHQQTNNNNNHSFRPSNNNRYQRQNNNNNNNNINNNNSLPLSAYMNTDNSLNQNENMNWGTSYQRRRSTQQRPYQQDKHQFPLSSYDPRQYGFNNNYQRRNDLDNRSNLNRRNINNSRNNNNGLNNSNDIDLIEECWEDDNTELIGTNQSTINIEPKVATKTVDDSGNSSLSTSMNLKESILDDEENNLSTNDFANAPSDVSTTDSNIIESLDKLQEQLKLEEAVDERLASANNDNGLTTTNNEPPTYDTAHFMQWAKEKFREELAGRLTAQEIQQHDAVTTDDDDDDDGNHVVVPAVIKTDQPTIDIVENMDALEDDLNEKLTIDENLTNTNQSIVVE